MEVIASLKATFPASMQTPLERSKVFRNGFEKGRFYVAKGPLGQTVGLSYQDAEKALEVAYEATVNDPEEEGASRDDLSGSESTTSDVDLDGFWQTARRR